MKTLLHIVIGAAALAVLGGAQAAAPAGAADPAQWKLVWADEFDYIMEYWARRPHEMTATVHWRKDGQHQQDHGRMEVPESLAGFHVYALEWSAARMDFFCDGKRYHTVPLAKLGDQSDNAFRQPHYILLNLALEGRGQKIDDAALPQQFIVDYVRVYEPK